MQHDHITVGELFRLSPRSGMHHVLCIQNIWDKIKVFQRIYLPKWSDISKNDSTYKTCVSSFCIYKRESFKKKKIQNLNEIGFFDKVYYTIKNILKLSSTIFCRPKSKSPILDSFFFQMFGHSFQQKKVVRKNYLCTETNRSFLLNSTSPAYHPVHFIIAQFIENITLSVAFLLCSLDTVQAVDKTLIHI